MLDWYVQRDCVNNNPTVDKRKDGTSKLKSQEFGNLINNQTVDK